MNRLKMLLEEILPFYFLIMIGVIMFTAYVPTMFELYIVYAFAFGVAIFNKKLYDTVEAMRLWGDDVLETVDVLEKENKILRRNNERLTYELEECLYDESDSVGISPVDDGALPEDD
jgi:hypothetical protein